MHWNGRQLIIDVDEIGAPPMITRVKGRITLTPAAVTDIEVALTPDRRHVWRPFAPTGHIEVDLTQGQRWQGHGYFDANFGSVALETDFKTWSWGRYPMRSGALCFYDAVRADGSSLALGISVARDGSVRPIDPPPLTAFSRSLWALKRETRADAGVRPRQVMPMLDAPFYSRSLVQTQVFGEVTTGVHEALDLTRFTKPWLKPMLALRVPRRAGWVFND